MEARLEGISEFAELFNEAEAGSLHLFVVAAAETADVAEAAYVTFVG